MANPKNKGFDETEETGSIDVKAFEQALAGIVPKTTEQLMQDTMKAESQIATKVNNLRTELAKEPKEKIRISPAYQPFLGTRCQLGINGVHIVVECDGSMQEVPRSYAAILYARMDGIDKMLKKQSRMAKYDQNREQSMGELKF